MFKFLYKVREKCVILCVQEGEKMIDIFKELDKKFNIVEKTQNLSWYIVEEKEFNYYGNYYTFYELLCRYFHYWELNNNYRNLYQMLLDMQIVECEENDVLDDDIFFTINNEIQCYKFLQFLKNSLSFLEKSFKGQYKSIFSALENKILAIISQANLDFYYEESKGYYKLIESKKLVREIADKSSEAVAIRLYEYNTVENKNNLEKKKEILIYLATITEPITKSYNKKIKSGDIHDLYHILDFALNNLHIRHDNKTGTKKKEYVANLSDEKLIKIYDQVYDLILEVLSIEYAKDSLSALTEVKDKFDKKNLS